MKLNVSPKRANQGAFTLIEMIGVLAVIAILAALLLPKVFSAIADAKINNTVVSVETMKTAIADHYGKYGKFDALFGTNILSAPQTNYDLTVLFPETLIDKSFQTKLGTNWSVQMVAGAAAGNVTAANTGAYSLTGGGTNDAIGQYVMQCVVYGVAEADAQAISQRVDGNAPMSTTALGNADLKGKVQYDAPASAGGAVNVYIYMTHR